VDLEVARRGEVRREVRVRVVELAGADEPVAAASVPPLQELLARVRPLARNQQLELHRGQVALGAVAFGEVEQCASDA
jgi:hypothetical protein